MCCGLLRRRPPRGSVGLDWHAAKEIDKRRLQREVGTPCYDGLRLLAVDEVAIHKGHTYLTTVLDLETGRIVWVGKGRTEATLASFFAELTPEQLKSIEAVASDMASGFRKRHRREDGGDRGIGRSHSPEPHRQGMIYSPAHGDTAFTVPMFDEFLVRSMPNATERPKRVRKAAGSP
jgi:transposase InsO family protein